MMNDPDPPSHLYIHIPFCPTKCSYCAFVTHVGSLKLVEPYIDAVLLEAASVRRSHSGGALRSVYLGGGTPSLLSGQQVGRILDGVRDLFGLELGAEVTIEGHPSTVDQSKLGGYRQAGATRISFGAESLDPLELQAINRGHSPDDVLAAVEMSRLAGFGSVNLDLIYGLPMQTLESWERSLRAAIGALPDHLSLYPLSIEPHTVFARRMRDGSLPLPDDDAVVEMYVLACRLLAAAGYEHYEVANWAQPGHRSTHNLAYWSNHQYYGVGVGAHAYLGSRRTENMRGTSQYIRTVLSGGDPVAGEEIIDRHTEVAETVMLRLRLLRDGLDLSEIRDRYGLDLACEFAGDIDEMGRLGLLDVDSDRLRLPERAVPLANEVWERLMSSVLSTY